MEEKFYIILTNTGKASIANATALGGKVDFKYMALGDGNGKYYDPTEEQTELVNEVYRGQINHVTIDPKNPNWIALTIVIPATVGGFTIREVGTFDTDGNLLAIGKYPETYKPTAEDGSTKDITIKMIMEVSNASVVNLKVDPTVILATHKDIENAIDEIEIGGRNYLWDSLNIELKSNNPAIEPIEVTKQDDNIWKIISTKENGVISTYIPYGNGGDVLLKDYVGELTCSVEVMSPVPRKVHSTASLIHLIPNKWGKLITTRTGLNGNIPNSGLGIYSHDGLGQPLYYRNYKIEKGNKATDWTPALEDPLYIYEPSSDIDPNTLTQFQAVVKHANCPGRPGRYWWIETRNSSSSTKNKIQIATEYEHPQAAGGAMYTRGKWNDNQWSEWVKVATQSDIDETIDTLKEEILYEMMPINGGTFTGIAKAHPNASHATAQMRNIILSPTDPVLSQMKEGEIWFKYGDIDG